MTNIKINNEVNNKISPERESSEWCIENGFTIDDLNFVKERDKLINENLKKIDNHLKKLNNFEMGILIGILKQYDDDVSLELIREYNELNFTGWTHKTRRAYFIWRR